MYITSQYKSFITDHSQKTFLFVYQLERKISVDCLVTRAYDDWEVLAFGVIFFYVLLNFTWSRVNKPNYFEHIFQHALVMCDNIWGIHNSSKMLKDNLQNWIF